MILPAVSTTWHDGHLAVGSRSRPLFLLAARCTSLVARRVAGGAGIALDANPLHDPSAEFADAAESGRLSGVPQSIVVPEKAHVSFPSRFVAEREGNRSICRGQTKRVSKFDKSGVGHDSHSNH